jgi:hypothetical protein
MTYHRTKNEPRHHRLPLKSQSGDLSDFGVRAYRASPEDAMLQLRGPKGYTTVSLSEDECRAVAKLLTDAADDLKGAHEARHDQFMARVRG